MWIRRLCKSTQCLPLHYCTSWHFKCSCPYSLWRHQRVLYSQFFETQLQDNLGAWIFTFIFLTWCVELWIHSLITPTPVVYLVVEFIIVAVFIFLVLVFWFALVSVIFVWPPRRCLVLVTDHCFWLSLFYVNILLKTEIKYACLIRLVHIASVGYSNEKKYWASCSYIVRWWR